MLMELKKLKGKHIFTGVELGSTKVQSYEDGPFENANYVKFELDDITYIAVEDPDDGYRSYMKELSISKESIKYKIPSLLVTCIYEAKNDGYTCDILRFVDVENGETFLRIGTADTDDYYPYCVFEYKPENLHFNQNKWEV